VGLAGFALLARRRLAVDAEVLLKLPPVVIISVLAVWFGRTLAPAKSR